MNTHSTREEHTHISISAGPFLKSSFIIFDYKLRRCKNAFITNVHKSFINHPKNSNKLSWPVIWKAPRAPSPNKNIWNRLEHTFFKAYCVAKQSKTRMKIWLKQLTRGKIDPMRRILFFYVFSFLFCYQQWICEDYCK